MVIIQICESCGNGLQPDRGKIHGKHSIPSLGVCDVCQRTNRLYNPDEFGLPLIDVLPVKIGVDVDRVLGVERLS